MTLMRPNWPGSFASMDGAGDSTARPFSAAAARAVSALTLLRLVAGLFRAEVAFDFVFVVLLSVLLVRVVARCCTAAIRPYSKGF